MRNNRKIRVTAIITATAAAIGTAVFFLVKHRNNKKARVYR